MDAKWNFLNHFQLYGQFVLDEFYLKHLRNANGWWANKWASQLGIKYIDVLGLQNFDLQLEWNRSRPFMYSHRSDYTSYTHQSQPLAHPLGANFDEKMLLIRYQPLNRLSLQAQYLQASFGADSLNSNYGGNIFLNYNTRTLGFGNKIGQGVATRLQLVSLTASYMLAHRLYLDLAHTYRRQSTALDEPNNSTHTITAGLRWNIGRREHWF